MLWLLLMLFVVCLRLGCFSLPPVPMAISIALDLDHPLYLRDVKEIPCLTLSWESHHILPWIFFVQVLSAEAASSHGCWNAALWWLEVGHHAWYHIRLFLHKDCHVQSKASNSCRKSSISTNSKLHILSTTFLGRVGKPFATR